MYTPTQEELEAKKKEIEEAKADLEKRKTQIRASRLSLTILLVIEAVIVLMHFPKFLGAEWIENALVAMRTFLVDFLWPSDAADMITYKGTIYEICTWFQNLPVYPVLVQVMIYLVPGLFVLSIVRIKVLDWRIGRVGRTSKQTKTPKEKTDKEKTSDKGEKGGIKLPTFTGSDYHGILTPQEIKEANEYCERHRERCDDPFAEDPGIRIQQLTGEYTLGEARDYVIPWDGNGEINLSRILQVPAKVVREKDGPYFYTKRHGQVIKAPEPLRRYDPEFAIVDDNGRDVVCVITWLGG